MSHRGVALVLLALLAALPPQGDIAAQGDHTVGAWPALPPGWAPVQAPAQPALGGQLGLRLGTDLGGLRDLLALGAAPDYAVIWAGAWNWKGWDKVREGVQEIADAGAVPVVHWYYWGDDISPQAVTQGVYSAEHKAWKTPWLWRLHATQLAMLLGEVLQGREGIVVLETEFNKRGVEKLESFDGDLAEQAGIFRAWAPSVRLALGLGNWGRSHWATFDRAAAASDIVGVQALRAPPKHDAADYLAAADSVAEAAAEVAAVFGKPLLLTDLGLSSWGGFDAVQAEALRALLADAPRLQAAGLEGIVYRSWRDHPKASLGRYFGPAERHWGLADADGLLKPAGAVWLDAMAARAAPVQGSA